MPWGYCHQRSQVVCPYWHYNQKRSIIPLDSLDRTLEGAQKNSRKPPISVWCARPWHMLPQSGTLTFLKTPMYPRKSSAESRSLQRNVGPTLGQRRNLRWRNVSKWRWANVDLSIGATLAQCCNTSNYDIVPTFCQRNNLLHFVIFDGW